MPQNGCHVHLGKAKPSPTPTWVRLGLMGSLLGFPEVRAGLGWGFLGQGQSVVTSRVPGDSSIICWCLGRQVCLQPWHWAQTSPQPLSASRSLPETKP